MGFVVFEKVRFVHILTWCSGRGSLATALALMGLELGRLVVLEDEGQALAGMETEQLDRADGEDVRVLGGSLRVSDHCCFGKCLEQDRITDDQDVAVGDLERSEMFLDDRPSQLAPVLEHRADIVNADVELELVALDGRRVLVECLAQEHVAGDVELLFGNHVDPGAVVGDHEGLRGLERVLGGRDEHRVEQKSGVAFAVIGSWLAELVAALTGLVVPNLREVEMQRAVGADILRERGDGVAGGEERDSQGHGGLLPISKIGLVVSGM